MFIDLYSVSELCLRGAGSGFARNSWPSWRRSFIFPMYSKHLFRTHSLFFYHQRFIHMTCLRELWQKAKKIGPSDKNTIFCAIFAKTHPTKEEIS